jgi:uncharacterized membrane protein
MKTLRRCSSTQAPSVRDRRGLAVAIVLAGALGAAGWARHANFWSGGLDLGVFDQGVWLMSRGRVPDISLLQRNLFSDHLSPVLVLFALPYRLAPTPAWLIGAQALCIGATVLPLRALADDEGVPRGVVTVAVVLSAPLAAAAMFDFHPSTLATPFVGWALLGARRGDRRLTTWSAIAVVLCRADLGCVLAGIALVAHKSVRRRLLVLAPVAVLAGAVVPELLGNPGTWDPYYGHLGTGPVDALLHPWNLVRALLTEDALSTFAFWLLPVGFLPVLRPRWLLAIVVAGLPVAVSQWPGTHLPWFHYGAPIAPLAIGGAIAAWGHPAVRDWHARSVLAGAAVVAAVIIGPLSPNAPASVRLWEVVRPHHRAAYETAVKAVPANAPVSATNQVLAHLMHRRVAYFFPLPFAPVRDTFPGGLAPAPSATAAARVPVIIARDRDRDLIDRIGFRSVEELPGGLVVARR